MVISVLVVYDQNLSLEGHNLAKFSSPVKNVAIVYTARFLTTLDFQIHHVEDRKIAFVVTCLVDQKRHYRTSRVQILAGAESFPLSKPVIRKLYD